MLDRFAIASALREISALLELQGENQFKARAYARGADALEGITEDLGTLIDERRLTAVRGIGASLAAVIGELHSTGHTGVLDKLRAELPLGMLEISRLPGLGVKKAKALQQSLKLRGIDDLKAACEAGAVRGLAGFGARTEQKILEAIAAAATRRERVLLADVLPIASALLGHLTPAAEKVEVAGSVRRAVETAGDIDLVAASSSPSRVIERLRAFPAVVAIDGESAGGCRAKLGSGLTIDLYVATPPDFAGALLAATGSSAHHARLVELAAKRGMTLDARGLSKDGARLHTASEAEIYDALGLPFIPPELREDEGEVEAALAGDTFADLIVRDDVIGAVHCHTTWSDGRATVEEMALAAEKLGFRYLTITDHSPSASYAGGVTPEKLAQQWKEIAGVQAKVGLELLRGTESDILQDGSLDWPAATLASFDVVIASVHSRFKLDEAQMTERVKAAMRHPIFKIWGHALGRLILKREPYAARVEEILDTIAASRAAIEVNGDPHRLDLEPRWIREARKRKIPFVISSDAHSTEQIANAELGVLMARRGGVRRSEVLNALEVTAFKEAVRPTRA